LINVKDLSKNSISKEEINFNINFLSRKDSSENSIWKTKMNLLEMGNSMAMGTLQKKDGGGIFRI
jgi:hypothetical protein